MKENLTEFIERERLKMRFLQFKDLDFYKHPGNFFKSCHKKADLLFIMENCNYY